MSHYDSCREAAEYANAREQAREHYRVELNQLGSAVELIKAIAHGLGEDPNRLLTSLGIQSPKQICDKWLMDNGYECEATRAAQKAKKLAEIEAQIAKLQKEKESL